MSLATVDQDTFRKVCSRFATGIAVATVVGRDEKPYGLTVNSFTSVSCNPPLVLVCIDYRCTILPEFRASQFFGVNILGGDQRDLSVRFSQKQSDRFDGIGWTIGSHGAPLLDGSLATMECCTWKVVEAGDHAVFIGEVVEATQCDGDPLVYFSSGYRQVSR